MKKIYIKPLTGISLYNAKTAMLAGSGTQGSIVDGEHNFDPVVGPVTPVGPDGPPSEAKGGDFFEEPISPSSSSIWGDED